MENNITELVALFNRDKLNNLLFKFQIALTAIGGAIAILIHLLLNLFFPVWVGWIFFLIIFIYIAIISFNGRKKVIKDYDEEKIRLNKLFNL